MQQIFEDTWRHFVEEGNPPGLRPGSNQRCSYASGCAIGRLMPKEWRKKADAEAHGPSNIYAGYGPEDVRKELVETLDIRDKDEVSFLQSLQWWHDDELTAYHRDKSRREQLEEEYREIGNYFGLDADGVFGT